MSTRSAHHLNGSRRAEFVRAGVLIGVLALFSASAAQDENDRRTTDLVESTGARLIQLDVTLTGPPELLDSLTPDSFSLKIGLKRVEEFTIDKVCRDAPEAVIVSEPEDAEEIEETPIPLRRRGTASFLFYFDQAHLTLNGRASAMDTAHDLIDELIVDGNQGMVVSTADRIKTYTELTADREVLHDAVNRLERDREQWDVFAAQESFRISEIMENLRSVGGGSQQRGAFNFAFNLARLYYAEELQRAQRDNRRFAIALARLANVRSPKVAVYFADNMRTRAGMHYLELFSTTQTQAVLDEFGTTDPAKFGEVFGSTMGAINTFDQVINEAAAHGVRLYTVQAEGLVMSRGINTPGTNRVREAQDTMRDFALETGGQAFLNGVRSSKIAKTIREDLSCLYVVSFDPEGLVEDRPQAVRLLVEDPKVNVQVRGRIVIQSDTSRLASNLLAAYSSPTRGEADIPIRSMVIPTGYSDGLFHALVQVTVPHSLVPAATWDLGASVISRGSVRDTAGRVTVKRPNSPVILQAPMTFRPGPFEVVAVGHNITADIVTSDQMEGEWPRPNAALAAIGPIAVIQKTRAAIVNGDEVKVSGLVAFDDDEPVDPSVPARIVAPVCKSKDQRGRLEIRRSLSGENSVPFPKITLNFGKDRCVLFQDVIPANTMTSGTFEYRIRVVYHGEELTHADRKFTVWDGAPL